MNTQIQQIEDSALPYAYWLSTIPGVGRKTIDYLLSKTASPETLYNLSEAQLCPLLTEEQKKRGLDKRIMEFKHNRDVHEDYHKLLCQNIHFTCLGHYDYPERLANISDAPYALYYLGQLPAQDRPSVAIIGARNCSEYGRRMAECFGRELAMAGIQIISGMARGIDGIGQKGALAAGGYSLGVMGCGVDICYPAENKELYDILCTHGGICSEYPPETLPKNSLFPPRNRIISALSDVVLVIEAKNRSGTLITVDMALEQGKEVYALPGRVTDALSEGCNRLIQQGAGIAVSPQDIVRTIMESTHRYNTIYTKSKIKPETNQTIQSETNQVIKSKANPQYKANLRTKPEIKSKFNPETKPKITTDMLSDVQHEIISILDDTPKSVEKIKEHMLSKFGKDIPISELMNQLVKLSLYGLAKQISNSYFVRG